MDSSLNRIIYIGWIHQLSMLACLCVHILCEAFGIYVRFDHIKKVNATIFLLSMFNQLNKYTDWLKIHIFMFAFDNKIYIFSLFRFLFASLTSIGTCERGQRIIWCIWFLLGVCWSAGSMEYSSIRSSSLTRIFHCLI